MNPLTPTFLRRCLLSLVFGWLCLLGVACHISPPLGSHKGLSSLDQIKVPDGFALSYYAQKVPNARSMALSDDMPIVYVGTRMEGSDGKVYALWDKNNDYIADTLITIAGGLYMPNGVAWRKGALYVAEVNKIWRYEGIDQAITQGKPLPTPQLLRDDLPDESHHGWKYIRFGPDDKLYLPIGAPCNICASEDPRFATIMRMNPDGTGDLETVARGVRNSVGYDWSPETGELWFTDNGRDWLGDDKPPCELNRVREIGQHFGYPYCHADSISDPKLGDEQHPCSQYAPPAQALGAHVAPLGMLFCQGTQFPLEYQNRILIAEHGSWNSSKKVGYRLTTVQLDEQQRAIAYEPFAEGWLDKGKVAGRPVDLLRLPDGSVLVSDDYASCIYRITAPTPNP